MRTINEIEISFAIPVRVSYEQLQRLSAIVQEIAKDNTPNGHVHWVFGSGDKPRFSQADAVFLEERVDPDAPATGEPTFDDSVYFIQTACREK